MDSVFRRRHYVEGDQISRSAQAGLGGVDLAGPVLAGTVASAFCIAAVLTSWQTIPYPWWVSVPAQFTGLLWLAAGLYVWTRQPESARMARLLVAMGVTWYFGDLHFSEHPVLIKVGFWLFFLNGVVLAHLLLAYPNGRLARPVERGTIFALYAAVLSTQGLRALTERPLQPQMGGDPDAEYSVWAPVGSVLAIVLAGVVVVLVIQRWRSEPAPARRERGLFWAGVAFIATVVTAASTAALAGAPASLHSAMLLAYTLSQLLLGIAVLLGSLRTQMAHRRVSQILAESGRPLQSRLAKALEDPTLTLHYLREGSDVYVDEAGYPAPLPPEGERERTPVGPPGKPLALLVHDPFLTQRPRHRERLKAAVAWAGLALENDRLHDENLARARDLLQAEFSTRHRLSRALHDGTQHHLSGIHFLVGQLKHQEGEELAVNLSRIESELQVALDAVRDVSEVMYPSALSLGLADALDPLAQRSPIPLEYDVAPGRRPKYLEETAFFIISEAVGNAQKHAEASHITVQVWEVDGQLIIEVSDDGRGGARIGRGGSGLRGMNDRATLQNGKLSIIPKPQGGTTIRVVLPCA